MKMKYSVKEIDLVLVVLVSTVAEYRSLEISCKLLYLLYSAFDSMRLCLCSTWHFDQNINKAKLTITRQGLGSSLHQERICRTLRLPLAALLSFDGHWVSYAATKKNASSLQLFVFTEAMFLRIQERTVMG